MRVLISGGGLAGLTLAYWLQRYGITPVVIEQASGVRQGGYAIDFFGTGYVVAEKMGLTDWLQSRKLPIQIISYVDHRGRQTASLPIQLMEKIMYGRYLALMHHTLEEALYRAVENTVEVRFGCSLSRIQPEARSIQATFNDGRQETFDLLVGADGFHSNTRKLVFGPETQFTYPLGYTVASYPLPDRYGIGQAWKNYTEPGRMVGIYGSGEGGEVIVLFMYPSHDQGFIPRDQRLVRLHRAFTGMGWLTQQILEDTPESTDIYMDPVAQIRMSTWHKDRVALVGDAAYCLTLVSGQGASMAMGGAYLLANALHEQPDFKQAFQNYEAYLRPRIEQRQKSARDFTKSLVPGSKFGIFLQALLFKVALREAFIGLLRKQFGAESILSK